MAALYPYSFLNHIDTEDIEVPLHRYTHKFSAHRKEVVKLKLHEKDFLFRSLKLLRDDSNSKVFDLFQITYKCEEQRDIDKGNEVDACIVPMI